MIKPFIFFDAKAWQRLDPTMLSRIRPEFRFWFHMGSWSETNGHLTSRVHDLATPWPLTSRRSVSPLDLGTNWTNGKTDFALVIDSIAQEYVQYTINTNKKPFLFWSGGIDSTSILVALIKNNNKEFLDRLTVVCNRKSFMENPYFYDRFIKDRFLILDTEQFSITPENYSQIVILDGEGGNQMFGSGSIYDLARKGRYDLLEKPYSVLLSMPYDEADRFSLQLIEESLPYSPVPIKTVYDFLWWGHFNFKLDEVLLRKILVYSGNLSPYQRAEFWHAGLKRIFAHPEMQRWSMATLDSRRESLRITTKYDAKKYIFEFDKNEIYFLQKRETASLSYIFESMRVGTQFAIGINEDWELVDIKNRQNRIMMGQLLKSWI